MQVFLLVKTPMLIISIFAPESHFRILIHYLKLLRGQLEHCHAIKRLRLVVLAAEQPA